MSGPEPQPAAASWAVRGARSPGAYTDPAQTPQGSPINHTFASLKHFRSVPKAAPARAQPPACFYAQLPLAPLGAPLPVGAGPAGPRKRRFPAEGTAPRAQPLPQLADSACPSRRRENYTYHNPKSVTSAPAWLELWSLPVKSQSPREAGNGVFSATEEGFAGATEVALATADVGAGAGLRVTSLEGRCLHPRARLLGRERW